MPTYLSTEDLTRLAAVSVAHGSRMKRVFVAGASGAVGRHACKAFQHQGWYVIALVCQPESQRPLPADQVLEAHSALTGCMAGVDLVVTCPELAPHLRQDALAEAHRANVPQITRLIDPDRNNPLQTNARTSAASIHPLIQQRKTP